ncbi:YraN family protein [bacterium]|nr:YraN family protein [bacterium]
MSDSTDYRKKLGAKGERAAEKFLKKQGFKPVSRNLRNKAGEIDLLMWDGEELVVVEVRSMQAEGEVWGSEKVPLSKRRQVTRVANHLLAELPEPLPTVRFDVCIVVMQPKPAVTHYINAFSPDE